MHSERNGMEGRIGGEFRSVRWLKYISERPFYQQLIVEDQVALGKDKQESWSFSRASLRP
jgi:hypothetical protein